MKVKNLLRTSATSSWLFFAMGNVHDRSTDSGRREVGRIIHFMAPGRDWPCRASFEKGVYMRTKYYPKELKAEAIRLVVEHRLSATVAASRLDVRAEAVRIWVRRYRSSRRRVPNAEPYRLEVELHKAAVERDVLVNLAARLLARAG